MGALAAGTQANPPCHSTDKRGVECTHWDLGVLQKLSGAPEGHQAGATTVEGACAGRV